MSITFPFSAKPTLTEQQVADIQANLEGQYLGASSPEYYPNATWDEQQAIYERANDYFYGTVLTQRAQKATKSGDHPLLYPLKINLCQPVAFLLAASLLGEYDDNHVLRWSVVPQKDNESQKAKAKAAEEIINDLFEQNDRDGLMITAASTSQIYGGSVLRARFDPSNHPELVIEAIPVEEFRPVWDSANRHRILEYFYTKIINRREAELKYGVNLDKSNDKDTVIYQEHWTEQRYEITIDGKPAKAPFDRDITLVGDNPYVDPFTKRQILPVEYFPTWIPSAGSFYGVCPIASVYGVQDEINTRLADMGDAVAQSAHRQMWVRGWTNAPRVLSLDPNNIMNLGLGVPNHASPELNALDPPVLPAGTAEFIETLMDMFRLLTFTPKVAYGIDEGSQRSAMTLVTRMHQLIAKTRVTRTFWMSSFQAFIRKLLVVALSKNLVPNLTADHLLLPAMTQFAPILPKDKEQTVNEIVQLASANFMTPEWAFELYGERKVEERVAQLKEYEQWKSKMAAAARPEPFGGQSSKTGQQQPKADQKAKEPPKSQ